MSMDTCPCWTQKDLCNANEYCAQCKARMQTGTMLRERFPAVYDVCYLPARERGAK